MGTSSPVEAAQINLGKYSLIEKIGEGYLGAVYRGFDQDLGRPVVVRILCDGIKWDPRLEETFELKCRALTDLRHANVAEIFEIGQNGPIHYIAMESLGSGTLENLIAQNTGIPVETRLSIIIQIAEGLSYAHKKGVLHRDLVPGKIHLAPDGRVKIRDFAIASLLMKHLPHPAVRFGAPIYLCPEQIQHADCDHRSDIFSAGTIFYELITHCHPFHDRDSNKALDNILSEGQIPTFEKFPDAPPGIWMILKSCLARHPEDRFQSAEELATACRDLLKSLQEDTQLMLGELYASLSPLRRAASKPNASMETRRLLEQIEKLLKSGKPADYGLLDRLMTKLMEQSSVIQAAADELPEIDAVRPQIPPGEIMAEKKAAPPQQAGMEPKPVAGTPSASPSAPPATGMQPPSPIDKGDAATREKPQLNPESAKDLDSAAASDEKQPIAAHSEAAARQSESATPVPSMSEKPETASNIVAFEPERPRYRRIPKPSYRTAAALLAVLVIAAAVFIFRGSETAARFWESWNLPTTNTIRQVFAYGSGKQPDTTGEQGSAGAADIKDQESVPGDAFAQAGGIQQLSTDVSEAKGINAIRKDAGAKQLQEQSRRDEEQRISRQKEEALNRQLTDMMARGNYGEAAGALSLWVSENPGSQRAQDLNARVQEIQRQLKTYTAAMAENRYPEALHALNMAEKLNPSDQGFAEMRRQAEARRSAARATLSIRRLGAKAVLLLDGRPFGKEGEAEAESIPIGSHTVTIENSGISIATKTQEYFEGQTVTLVYDLVKQNLRAMSEADRDLISGRKSMEEIERFSLLHPHGVFRGTCRGILSLNSLDIAYTPASGSHGFRIPFKLMKLKMQGKSASISYISDNTHFQTFTFEDDKTAARFEQKWDELKSLLR